MTSIEIDVTADIVEPEIYLVEPEVVTEEEVSIANQVLHLRLTDDCGIKLHYYQADELLAVLARAIAPHYEDSDSEDDDGWQITPDGKRALEQVTSPDFLGQLPTAEDEPLTEEVA